MADAAEARSLAGRGGSSSSSSSRRATDNKSSKSKASDKDGKDGWADDSSVTECFLTGTRFTVVQRKHHCRYCGQIFIADVCKKTIKIPSAGHTEPVRVCDVCFDQVERGDPVCLSRCVAKMRTEDKRDAADGAKELANWGAMDPQFATDGLVTACEQLKVPETVASLLGASSSTTQSAAASLLGAMMQYPEYAELLEGADILRPLLTSLRGSKAELKLKAANALVSLTGNAAGRIQLRTADGLAPLLDILLGSGAAEPELWEATCAVLANMCDDEGTDDWRTISQSGAVFALAGQLGTSNVPLQEALLTLLALLCGHPECRDQAADAGAMPALCRLLSTNKPNVQRAARKRVAAKSTVGHVAQKEKRRKRINVDGYDEKPPDELADVFS